MLALVAVGCLGWLCVLGTVALIGWWRAARREPPARTWEVVDLVASPPDQAPRRWQVREVPTPAASWDAKPWEALRPGVSFPEEWRWDWPDPPPRPEPLPDEERS